MLYMSKLTNEFYKTAEECQQADEKFLAEKRAVEERKNAKKAEVEEAYDRLRKARNEYDSLRDAFVRDYGSLRMKVDVNDLGGLKDLFSYLNLG